MRAPVAILLAVLASAPLPARAQVPAQIGETDLRVFRIGMAAAELPAVDKNRLSHRGQALRQLVEKLR